MPPSEDGRRRLALAAALLLVGIGAGVAARRRLARLADGEPKPRSFPHAALSADVSALWNRLVAILGLPGSRRFTFERLSALLLRHRGDSVARAFAAEFLETPELRALWEEYRKGGDGIDSEWLARRLEQSQAFAGLLNRYARTPGFLDIGETVALELGAEVARLGSDDDEEDVSVSTAATLPVGAPARPRARARPPGPSGAVQAGRLRVFGLPAGATGVRVGATTRTAAEAFALLGPGGPGRSRARATPGPPLSPPAPSLDGAAALPLAGARDVAIPGMPPCFPADKVEPLVSACIDRDVCTFWAACAAAGLESVCADACRNCGNCPRRPAPADAPQSGDPAAAEGSAQPAPSATYGPPADGSGGPGPSAATTSNAPGAGPGPSTGAGGSTQFAPVYWTDPDGSLHAGVVLTSPDGTATLVGNDGQDFGGAAPPPTDGNPFD